MKGLRPPQEAAKPKSARKPKRDGNSSDEELKKMEEQTKKYMNNHMKKAAPPANPRTFRRHNPNAVIPEGYTCHRCHTKGHLISDCPTNGMPEFDIARAHKGIPKNLKEEDLSEHVEDKYVKTLLNNEISYIDTSKGIMDEFKCYACYHIYSDPNIVPCCKVNYCRECIMGKIAKEQAFKCPNCLELTYSSLDLVPNTKLELLSNLYRRELILKRHIKEVEKEARAKIEMDIGELNQDYNQDQVHEPVIDLQQMAEEYETDEEDYKLLENALGLNNIEKEIKEEQSKAVPEKNATSSKLSAGVPSASKSSRAMPKTGIMPPMMGTSMMPGMMPINPQMMEMFKNLYMQPGMMSGGVGNPPQFFPQFNPKGGMPYMNPDALRSMKGSKSHRMDGDKGSRRDHGRRDKDKSRGSRRKRDQKGDKKDSY